MAIDNDKLMDFLHRFVGDLGAALAAGNVVIGNRLGLYAALATGPATPSRAGRAHRAPTPRYVTEWLRGQASGGYVTRTESGGEETYSLTEEQAFCLADPDNADLRPGRVPLRARAR